VEPEQDLLISNANIEVAESKMVNSAKPVITARIAIKTRRFQTMISMIFFGFFMLSYVQSVYKSIKGHEVSDLTMTRAGQLGAILSAISRVFWGTVQD
jgi:hypothetical protein